MIRKRENRRKIYYVPGMISLIVIPLLCFYHFYKVDAFKEERCMDIYICNDSIGTKNIMSYKRNYKVFNFNNSLDLERKKLNRLRFDLKELNRTNDTINGIQVCFGTKMKYEVYIEILDIFFAEKETLFMQYKNNFFVLRIPKPKNQISVKIVPITCGYFEANKDYILEQERKRKYEYYLSLYKQNWIVLLGYLGIVFLNIFAVVKFNKNR
ncbi:MAG: hypothetical protein RSD71_10550 [Flavobacterium sp.]|uniref:hypothetical protein n=1 Tax=Flavobacterium sp. TaxID=239 RepID=UPI002FCB40D6